MMDMVWYFDGKKIEFEPNFYAKSITFWAYIDNSNNAYIDFELGYGGAKNSTRVVLKIDGKEYHNTFESGVVTSLRDSVAWINTETSRLFKEETAP